LTISRRSSGTLPPQRQLAGRFTRHQPRSVRAKGSAGAATDTIDWIRTQHDMAIFGRIIRDMIKVGRFGGIEVGFMRRITQVLLDGRPCWLNCDR